MASGKAKAKGTTGNGSTTTVGGKATRYTAPTSNKAPRILVAEGNRSVESQIIAAGGNVVDSPWLVENCIRELADCDGLVITGGGDVNPRLYGQTPHRQVYGLTSSRDLRELALLGAARDLGLPVLGICRGMQIIAVEAGGTLLQHVPDKVHHDNHSCSMMPVRTVRGSMVHRALGEYPDMLHLHHQAIKRIPAGFTVTARHADGIVEAIESNDGRVVGVQFHPESVLAKCEGHTGWRLFDAFVASCARYKRRNRDGRPALRSHNAYTEAWPVAVEAYANRNVYVGKYSGTGWGQDDDTRSATPVKVTDKRVTRTEDEKGKVVELRPKSSGEVGGATSAEPIAWCGPCGVAFDFINDYVDHVDYFHPGTPLPEEVLMCYVDALMSESDETVAEIDAVLAENYTG